MPEPPRVTRIDEIGALAVGGRAGEAYEVSPWESSFVALRGDPGFPRA